MRLQLRDYRLTTVEILYRMPDHPDLLQSYIWQKVDLAPEYPELHKFLAFWKREIEADLHTVRVMTGELAGRASVRHSDAMLYVH